MPSMGVSLAPPAKRDYDGGYGWIYNSRPSHKLRRSSHTSLVPQDSNLLVHHYTVAPFTTLSISTVSLSCKPFI